MQCVSVATHARPGWPAWRRIDDRVASRALLCCTTIQPHSIVPTHGSLALNTGGCGACSHVQAMDNCVSEELIRQIADAVVNLGMKDLGYQYAALLRCSRVHMLRSPHTAADLKLATMLYSYCFCHVWMSLQLLKRSPTTPLWLSIPSSLSLS